MCYFGTIIPEFCADSFLTTRLTQQQKILLASLAKWHEIFFPYQNGTTCPGTMATMINISQEFGYKVSTFHHGVEAYKIADLLADEGICAALWADWWGFKHEAYDMTIANIAIVDLTHTYI